MDKAAFLDFTVEIIRRSDTAKGFEILPRRWVVERTFGWMVRWRRLVKDYEKRIDVAEAMIHIAMGSLMLRRNAHPWISKKALSANLFHLFVKTVSRCTKRITITPAAYRAGEKQKRKSSLITVQNDRKNKKLLKTNIIIWKKKP